MKKTVLISAFSIVLLVPVMAQNLMSLSVSDLAFRLGATIQTQPCKRTATVLFCCCFNFAPG